MDIVVINLDKSTDRLEKMKKQFHKLNLPLTRFPAIYGKNLEKHILDNKTTFACKELLCNYGMIGCFLSHMEIIKNFYTKSYYPFICIMEDDIILSEEFPLFLDKLPTIYDQTNFDIVSLFCLGVCSTIKEKVQISNYTMVKPVFPLSATCYVLSRKGAERIQNLLGEKIVYHIDFSIAFSRIFKELDYFLLTNPSLVSLEDGDSTMGTNSKSIAINILKLCNAEKPIWFLNVPVFSFRLKYTISLYLCILIVLLFIAICKKFRILIFIILLEIILLLCNTQNQ
jgi:glycosyl transferase family 25